MKRLGTWLLVCVLGGFLVGCAGEAAPKKATTPPAEKAPADSGSGSAPAGETDKAGH